MSLDRQAKLAAYWSRWDSYWPASPAQPGPRAVFSSYPLDIRPRLEGDHYGSFDEAGLPRRLYQGRLAYSGTTVTSYALASFDRDGCAPETEGAAVILSAARWILEAATPCPAGGLAIASETAQHGAIISAMTNGEALSVLARAHALSSEAKWRDTALELARAIGAPAAQGGLSGVVSSNGRVWYEEHVSDPMRHILNGKIYALWGLYEAHRAFGDSLFDDLWHQGVESVAASLPLFDTGWWSRYHHPEPGARHYLASMMYHSLHIVQLARLHEQSGREEFLACSDRFRRYTQNPACRIRAASAFITQKVRLKLAR